MRLLTATGCRSWSDFAACAGCYGLLGYLAWLMVWPA
jgi:hypothetical protein